MKGAVTIVMVVYVRKNIVYLCNLVVIILYQLPPLCMIMILDHNPLCGRSNDP